MSVILPVIILLAFLSGGLFWRLILLRRKLRETLLGAAAHRSSGSEELAFLQNSNEALAEDNRYLQARNHELQQELATLIYSISHDLRAPLRSVTGFAQALAEDYGPRLDPVAQDYLRRVRTSSLHLNALIDELLVLSRVVRAPFQPETIDLSATVRKVAAEIGRSDPTRRVEWYIQPELSVVGDVILLTDLTRHLLENAWKFSAGKPVSHISFRAVIPEQGRSSESVVYEVRDDGAGFDTQYAGKLFGVFQRMHSADEFSGHGVGLAASQRIVRRHGGRIWATAELGQGAVFSFTLDSHPEALPVAKTSLSSTQAVVVTEAIQITQPKTSVV